MGFSIVQSFILPLMRFFGMERMMRRHGRRLLVLAMLMSMAPVLSAVQVYPVGDLNQDFKVDLDDLTTFADQWLENTSCVPPDCAELDGLGPVTLSDFSILADHWLEDFGLPLVINEFNTDGLTEIYYYINIPSFNWSK